MQLGGVRWRTLKLTFNMGYVNVSEVAISFLIINI
jgi:hypothetical protein